MRQFLQKTITVLLVALSLAGGLLDILHHHGEGNGGAQRAAIAQHSCGAKERHIPLDEIPRCPVCASQGTRIVGPVTSGNALPVLSVAGVIPALSVFPALRAVISLHGTRAPPSC